MDSFFTLIFYILIAILFPYFTLLAVSKKDRNQRIYFIILVSFLAAVIVGFRGYSGTDTAMYVANYNFGPAGTNRWVEMESGFVYLNQIFKSFGIPVELFFIFISFLTNLFALLSINRLRDSINIYVASFVYFTTIYFRSFNIIRQTLAVTICLYAIIIFLDKKYISSTILILLATQIHRTAYLCLFVIVAALLFKGRKSKWMIAIAILSLLILVMHRNSVGNLILLLTHNQYYAGYVLRNSGSSSSFAKYYLRISPVIIFSLLNVKRYKDNQKFLVLFALMVMGYILSSLGVYTATEINRIGLYFTSLNIFVMGYVANSNIEYKRHQLVIDKKILSLLIIIYFLFSMLIGVFVQKNNQIVPYHSNPSFISTGGDD
ncbi:MAG: EpsG family protein [Limosilactobacillus sp.]